MKKSILITCSLGIILISAVTSLKWRQISDATPTVTEINFVDGVTSPIQAQLNSKVATIDLVNPWPAIRDTITARFDNTSLTGIPTAPTAVAGTNNAQVANTESVISNLKARFDLLKKLGSDIVGIPVAPEFTNTSSSALIDNVRMEVLVYVPNACTIHGIRFVMAVAGNYTPDNYNGIGLSTLSGINIHLVASTTNDTADPNMFEATANTIVTSTFSSSYSAAAGFYIVTFLYNSSAQTTAPSIIGANTPQSAMYSKTFFGTSVNMAASKTASSTIPSDTDTNTSVTNGSCPYLLIF